MPGVITEAVGVRGTEEQLEARVEDLEAEIEGLEDALAGQEFYIIRGYIVAVRPVGDGTFIARCPTLHASVQERSSAEAIESLREAMQVAIAGRREAGSPIPPKDTDARCLD